LARATITNVKIRFNGNTTDKQNSFCIFFTNANKNYVPFKIKESCIGRHYLIATCDGGLDDRCYKKSKEWDIDTIEIYGTEDDIHFRVVKEYKEEKAELTPGPFGKIMVESVYQNHIFLSIGSGFGGVRYILDPKTQIRINSVLLKLKNDHDISCLPNEEMNEEMKALEKLFSSENLKYITCIGFCSMPVNGASKRRYIAEINLDVPQLLRVGLFEQVVSYPENYYILRKEITKISTGRDFDMGIPNRTQVDAVERLKDLYLTTGIRFDHNVEDKNPVQDLAERWINGAKWDPDTCKRYMGADIVKKEETKMNRKKSLGIKNIIFNEPATIIFWSDNAKTVVKCQEGDVFDPEVGVAMAVMKRALGTNETDSNYLDKVKKYLDKYREKEQLNIESQDILTCVSNAIDTANEVLTGKVKDIQIRRLKSEAMDIRTKMMTSGATHWELETFDRFCRKYIAEKEENDGGKKE
jgi:hypothetical protein